MDFLTLKPKAFGLDISDSSLKIIDLKRKGKLLSLSSWSESAIKAGIIEEGEIKDQKLLVEIIKKSLAKINGEKLKTKNVIASLPEKKAFLQVIKMPKMKEEELKTAVFFEAENYIPFPIQEVYLDFQVVRSPKGYSDKELDVLIAAIPKETVDPYVSCLKQAGLFPLALEIESQSISRALIKNGVSPSPVFLVDFGKSKTTFIIYSGYSLQFTSSVPLSSNLLTKAVARSLVVDDNEAERIKIKYGLNAFLKKELTKKDSKVNEGRIFEAMIPVLTDLAEQIGRYLQYYKTHADEKHSKEKINKILLSGNGSNLKGLTDFLSAELKISVELANPWINILPDFSKKIPEIALKESFGYTTALGLALRGV